MNGVPANPVEMWYPLSCDKLGETIAGPRLLRRIKETENDGEGVDGGAVAEDPCHLRTYSLWNAAADGREIMVNSSASESRPRTSAAARIRSAVR